MVGVVLADGRAIKVDASFSFWRREREQAVDLLGRRGNTRHLHEYLEFSRGRRETGP